MIKSISVYNIADGAITGHYQIEELLIPTVAIAGFAYIENNNKTATHVIDGAAVTIPKEYNTAEKLVRIRRKRNQLLAACDFTILSDSGRDKVAWTAYRAALRDFPATCNPDNPAWPTPPEAL